MTKPIIDYLLGRLSEASTYAGLGAILGGLHISLKGNEVDALVGILISLAGLAATILKDKGVA
jgi:hypothetical protein